MIPPRRPPEPAHRVFRGSSVVARGLLTPDDLRGPAWQRLLPGVHVCAEAVPDHAVIARAAAGVLLPHAVVSGVSAAVLWDLADLAGPSTPVEVTVPPGSARSTRPGLVVHRRSLPDADLRRHRGVLVTCPVTTALDLAGRFEPTEAVVLLDRFVAERLTDLPMLRHRAAGLTGRGSRRARTAAARADGLAGSSQETRLRLCLHAARLPRPVAQFVVRHAGRFVGRVDFA